MVEDYCELCDLPKSQCIHGQPPPAPPVRTPKAPRPRPARQPATPKPTARSASTRTATPSRRTDAAAFRPLIVAALREAGGRLDAEEVREELEHRLGDVLLERDRRLSPQGEPRWWTNARVARKAMIDEGMMVQGRPGVWELTDKGWGR